jgi:molybdopterin synthase sulfur carrier subunit
MPTLQIPTVYRGHTRREASVEVEGSTIGACLDAAEAEFPGFRALVVDDSGMTHKFNKVFLDGELLARDSSMLETPVGPDAEIEVMAAIAGG